MDKENTDNAGKKSSVVDDMDINEDEILNELPDSDEIQQNADLDISKIRERTFNKELSDLVTKIRSNESIEESETTEAINSTEEKEDIDISEEKLLQMFHRLFYKSVNLTEIDKINTAFNPFDLYKESSSDDLVDLIHNEMLKLSLPEYAILVYNIEKKCYTSYINFIDNLDENNIIIDTSEELFTSILANSNGIMLDHQIIERDLFLKKRFMSKIDAGPETAFLLISFYNFFKDFYKSGIIEGIQDLTLNILPILMIHLNENIGEQQKRNIYNKIKNKLTVYFFLLQKKILLEIQKSHSSNPDNVFNLLDYMFQKYNRYKDCVCCIVKYKNYVNIESLFVLNYLHIKLQKRLSDQASILRIEKDKLILFTRKSKRKILDQVIDDFNKLYNNLFQVEMFADDELNRNKICLLKNIKEHFVK